MNVGIALGSNLGDRKANLETAAQKLKAISKGSFRASAIDVNPAVVPAGAPDSWKLPFFNSVIEMNWDGSPVELLLFLKQIEIEIGRVPSERWAPRLIDLDILFFGDQNFESPNLQIPHPRIGDRSFVLGPLSQLSGNRALVGYERSVLAQLRNLKSGFSQWMGILNLTPDSFSDGATLLDPAAFEKRLELEESAQVAYLDLGAESTRPGAAFVDSNQEWTRLSPAFEVLEGRYRNQIFGPQISIDTRNAKTAAKAIQHGATVINDVSGLEDWGMIELLQNSQIHYVLMHSLCVPADPATHLAIDCDPVHEIKSWLESKLEILSKAGVSIDRVIFDPGIGFGKTATQSWNLLQRISEFHDLPVRILVGHSRKSFLQQITQKPAYERDEESIGVSLQLARKGVDILRVHEASKHIRAYRAFQATE